MADLTSFPPPAAVLLACARDPQDPRTAADLRVALARLVDWDKLESAAVRHGMAALLYRRVADLCPDAVPGEVLAAWRELALAVAKRSLRMQRQLLALLERLAEAGVPALVLKGPAFSQQLYGDATLRHFTDLDVLVHPRDVTAAHTVALTAGFKDRHPFDAVSETQLQKGMHEIHLSHPGTGLVLEIHWRVGPRFAADSLPADELFARSGRMELLGREVLGLGRQDVVLVLTVHAPTHGWLRIEDVAAIAAGLRRLGPTDARDLETLAAAHGCRRRLHIGVMLAATLARSSPQSALAAPAFADRRAKDLAAWAGARLIAAAGDASPFDSLGPMGRLREAVWLAQTLDSPGASMRHLWRRAFTAGVNDWGDGGDTPAGPREAAATFVRRQRRLWHR